MKKINEQATRIFCRLLQKINDKEHLKLLSDSFMPLTIERLDENITTPSGAATIYSLCHYYEQNGDLIRDPEMCFLIVDNREKYNDYDLIALYPQSYTFANIWLRNIKQQGFLK